MKIKGFNNFDLDGSYIYFIFSKELLYIGETQKITFSRWVQHFYKTGTFSKKATIYGIPGVDYLKDFNLLSIELDDLETLEFKFRKRTITQAIEHSIHELLHISSKEMMEAYYHKYCPEVDRYKIVSDTSKTAPKGIPNEEWKFARKYAAEILNQVYKYI